jgi:outer membrane protein
MKFKLRNLRNLRNLRWVCLLLLISSSTTALAELKVGVLKMELIVQEAPQAKVSQEKLKKEFKARHMEFESAENKLKTAFEQLKRDKDVLSEAEKRKKEKWVQKLQRDLQHLEQALKTDYSIRYQEEMDLFLRSVKKAVDDFAIQEKYDCILPEQAIIFHAKHMDVTKAVLKKLETVENAKK